MIILLVFVCLCVFVWYMVCVCVEKRLCRHQNPYFRQLATKIAPISCKRYRQEIHIPNTTHTRLYKETLPAKSILQKSKQKKRQYNSPNNRQKVSAFFPAKSNSSLPLSQEQRERQMCVCWRVRRESKKRAPRGLCFCVCLDGVGSFKPSSSLNFYCQWRFLSNHWCFSFYVTGFVI